MITGKHITDLNLDAFGEDLRDRFEPMLLNVLRKHILHCFSDDSIQNLTLTHLMTAHQIDLKLSKR